MDAEPCDCEMIEKCDECRDRWIAEQIAAEEERFRGFDPAAYRHAMIKPPLAEDELPF